MGGPFEHKGHLLRVAMLFLGGVVVFLVLQALLVPEGFGLYGHYRAGALDDNRSLALVYAGRAACLDCHADAAAAAKGGPHEEVRCEACHGPLAAHAGDPMAQEAKRPDGRALCASCHQSNVARPVGFPQVDAADHAGGEACTSCHLAHDPRMQDEPVPADRPAAAAEKGASR